MATTAQLQQDLINAVAKIRVNNDGAPMQVKFSDGKTRTVYRDGSGAEDLPGVNFRNLTNQFNSAEAALRPAPAPAPTPAPAKTTPISQVAAPQPTPQPAAQPAAQTAAPTSDFLSKTAFASPDVLKTVFPNIDSKTGMPVLNQKALDAVLKSSSAVYGGNYLDAQQYRDNYNKFGWNAKSDASSVANGAAALGLRKEMKSLGSYSYLNSSNKEATDADFQAAAQKAGVDLSPYYAKASSLYGGMNQSIVLDKAKAYNAIQNASKDLYLVNNTIGGDKHASILFKADGSGNLVPVSNAQTGTPAVNYFNATRNDMSGGFWSDFGPILGVAGAAIGIPAIMNAIGSAGVAAGTWEAANAAAGLGTASAGTLAPGIAAFLAGSSPVDAAIGAGQVFTSGGLAGSPAVTGSALAGLSADQIMAMSPDVLADEIVRASDLGSQTFPSTVNASTIPGATVPAIQGGTSLSSMLSNAGTSALKFLGLGEGATTADVLNNAAKLGLIGSAGQALGSYLGASGQADAAKQAAANQMAMFNTINQQYAPQRGAGYQALNQIRSMLPGQYTTYNEQGKPAGTATGQDYLTRQFTPQDLYAGLAPNYQFQLQQGQMANQRAANVAGGALSGNTLAGLERYTQDYAGNAYQQAFQNFQNQRGNIYNTLAGIAGLGQQAIGGSAQAGQAATTAAGQLGVGAAAANAAGMTGAANAVAGGLQNYQLNQILQQVLAQNQNVAQQNQG